MAFLHQQPKLCLGLDIAKDTITAADGTTTHVIDNQRRTIRAFLKSHKQADLVVCEPTVAMKACCSKSACVPASPAIAPTRSRSRASSAPTAPTGRAMPSMPRC